MRFRIAELVTAVLLIAGCARNNDACPDQPTSSGKREVALTADDRVQLGLSFDIYDISDLYPVPDFAGYGYLPDPRPGQAFAAEVKSAIPHGLWGTKGRSLDVHRGQLLVWNTPTVHSKLRSYLAGRRATGGACRPAQVDSVDSE
ncbi:hypothetical protein ACFL59_02765 [Planctomycetota bacterium]